MELPLERSDDRKRGDQAHIAGAIVQARAIRASVTCARCATRTATHLVNVRVKPAAVCARCADDWRRAEPVEREVARRGIAKRGRW